MSISRVSNYTTGIHCSAIANLHTLLNEKILLVSAYKIIVFDADGIVFRKCAEYGTSFLFIGELPDGSILFLHEFSSNQHLILLNPDSWTEKMLFAIDLYQKKAVLLNGQLLLVTRKECSIWK